MAVFRKLRPKFWDHVDVAASLYKHLFNFRRIWYLAVLLPAGVALVPLVASTVIDYNVTRDSVESEIMHRTSRLVSNTRRSVSFFLTERISALDFLARENSFDALNNPFRLRTMLDNLKTSFGGFADLGVIDPLGYQRTYVGPYNLEGIDYSDQGWYKEVLERGMHISSIFLGFRHVPHLVIAVRRDIGNGLFYVLRATLDTDRFNELLTDLELDGMGDAFLISADGKLQTPSRSHGKVLETVSLAVPMYSPNTEVLEGRDPKGDPLVIGYAYIHKTPFILMIVKNKAELMKPWYRTRVQLIGFLGASIMIILFVILGVATYLVNRIYAADQKRLMTLHQVEYSNKMASIGRLAAGVAHEINNPLAVINEKAGLIKDMFTMKEIYAGDEKLIRLADGIISSVERCARITRRLLSFMRHADGSFEPVNLEEIVQEVLGFLHKEAEYRSIAVSLNVPENIPQIVIDRGRLQEILLNVINNAFAAMEDGGHLDITARLEGRRSLSVTITDDGCGIPESDLERIFEPFFSTKTKGGGTGLGLSITSRLVQELDGSITVQSEEGKGTSFIITLPLPREKEGDGVNAGLIGGR